MIVSENLLCVIWLHTGEVQVSNAELCTIDMHGKIDFASSTKILDVAVTAMFGPPRYRAGALVCNFSLSAGICRASMAIVRQWRERNLTIQFVGGNELSLTAIPSVQHFCRRGTAKNTRMD
jgi:hypothetical protein